MSDEELNLTITEEESLSLTIAEDCAIPDLLINSFAYVDGSDVEIGTIVAASAFLATYSLPPTNVSLVFDGNPSEVIALPGLSFATANSATKTTPNAGALATLNASNGGPTAVANATKRWRARLFIGWTTDPGGPYTEADILALNELTNAFDSNALFDVTLSPTDPPTGAYLVCAYHDDFNGAVPADFEIGTFGNGDVTEVQTGLAMTIPNGTAPYTVARSDFLIERPTGIRFARET